MSEEPGPYNTQNENAAEIHPPKTIQVIQDKGLVEYRVWGWVKISAKFISHIKRLRGAKLSIWQVLACSIDEYGKCSLTIKELCELTGYSHTEVIDSLKELDEMGYLSIDRSGKKNLYTPEFAARGIDRNPSETLVKKLDSTPVDSVESSPSIEKSTPTSKELKELMPEIKKTAFDEELADIGWTIHAGKKVTQKQLYKRLESAKFEEEIETELKRLRLNWIAFDEKAKEVFRRFIRKLPKGQTLNQFVTWWLQDEWRAANPPWTLAIIMQRWLQAFNKQTDESRPEYKTYEAPKGNYVPRPKNS